MIHRLLIEDFPRDWTAEDLHKLLAEVGDVAWIYVELDGNLLPWGYAYVGFIGGQAAEHAMGLLQGEAFGRRLKARLVDHGPDEYFDRKMQLSCPPQYLYTTSCIRIEGGLPGSKVYIDGVEKSFIDGDGYSKVPLLPGKYTVAVRTPDGGKFSKMVVLNAGQELVFEPVEDASKYYAIAGYSIWGWIAVALCLFGGLPILAVGWLYYDQGFLGELPLSESSHTTTVVPPPGMVMVRAGRFVMGRFSEDPYESPPHTVEVTKDFFIDATEVTNQKYYEFVVTQGRIPPKHWKGQAPSKEIMYLPVVHVSWQDAADYCAWRSSRYFKCRLPSEAEWELAARGSEGWIYPWGNEWVVGAANAENVRHSPVEVASFKLGVSPSGAYDMVGNVWEWTADDLVLYPLSKAKTQKGKVVRGGAFSSSRKEATATFRGFLDPDSRNYDRTGFRCVCEN
ncbi:MAG: SUMF1/EgtB/PvdO family nonheme iron enzyme [Acidobacteriota bacterium]|nr:SUMF1/EgtB/PvdO family nonheme iron enzyme [Blastocatellia bacterium]MDW8413196.1 SUMF1/EgtB/PvdO family nonheme iron enzyme [Acidobacteriota bacterium]